MEQLLKLLPAKPGVYNYFDKAGELIYVGKAKDLSKRVRQYFVKSHSNRVQRLVEQIADIKWFVTKSEVEALLLELNMIKEHKPRFNILMTDDKTYPYIHITDSQNPRIETIRNPKTKKGKFFGPYPDGVKAREIVKILDRIFKLRKCKTLPDKPCLYYHMDQCFAPCINKVDKSDYEITIKEIEKFLTGKDSKVIDHLKKMMEKEAEELNFEKAQEIKTIIEKIGQTTDRQKITKNSNEDADYIASYESNGYIQFYVIHVRQGRVLSSFEKSFENYEEKEDATISFISSFYEINLVPKNIYIDVKIDDEIKNTISKANIITPQKGVNKDLINMAGENAKETFNNSVQILLNNEKRTFGAIVELGTILKIKTPKHIEIFDNSHLAGTNYVSSLVVYRNGKPSKNEWRKYNLTTVTGNDDYKAMEEVLERRYLKLDIMPDIIFVDGGKGQISVAKKIAKKLGKEMAIFGIVKDDKHRTRSIIDDSGKEYVLDRKAPYFFLLERMQDDAHNFAIRHQYTRHAKKSLTSVLDDVKGLGKARQKKLMAHFKTFGAIKQATLEELNAVLPSEVASELYKTLTNN